MAAAPVAVLVLLGPVLLDRWIGPDRVRDAALSALQRELGPDASLESATIEASWQVFAPGHGLVVDLTGIALGPELRVHHARVRIDPARLLLAGEIRIWNVEARRLRAVVTRQANGSLAPGRARTVWTALTDPGAEESQPFGSDRMVHAGDVAIRRVELRDSELIVRRQPRPSHPAVVEGSLRGIEGSLRLGSLSDDVSIRVAGDWHHDGSTTRLDVSIYRSRSAGVEAEAQIEGLEVAELPRLWAEWRGEPAPRDVRLAGRSDLRLTATREPDRPWQADVTLRSPQVRIGTPEGWPENAFELERMRWKGHLEERTGGIRITDGRLSASGQHVDFAGEIRGARGGDTELAIGLVLGTLDLARAPQELALLPRSIRDRVVELIRPIESGRISNVRLEGRTRLRDWIPGLAPDARRTLPADFRASADLADVRVELGDGKPLDGVGGRVEIVGERLRLTGLVGQRAGSELPMLDLTIDGLTHLFANDAVPPAIANVPPLPGLAPFYDIVKAGRPTEDPTDLLLNLERIDHPALLWPLHHVLAEVARDESGVRGRVDHAVWGRVPVEADALWTRGERDRLAVHLRASPALPEVATVELAPGSWARGRWHLGAHYLGRWLVHMSTGRFRAFGADVELDELRGDIGDAGRLSGVGSLDLSDPERVPYALRADVSGGQASALSSLVGLEEDEAEGLVEMAADLRGSLRFGEPLFETLAGSLEITATDGSIVRRLPALLAVAKVSDTLNPFGSNGRFRFAEIDAQLHFESGTLGVDELRIEGPDLRLAAAGAVSLLDPDHHVDGVIGVFFLRALDRVIQTVPFINSWILGPDENFFGAYVALNGPWKSPNGRLIPAKTVATGPASIALEGLPRFFRGAFEMVRGLWAEPVDESIGPGASESTGEEDS